MSGRPRPGSRVRDRRGAMLPFVAGSIVVLMGAAALAIDVGMLFTARSEAQRAAEAGAHAGALVLLGSPTAEDQAREQARTYAEMNRVRRVDVEVRPDEDIDVELENQLVRVRVHRTEAWGGPVATFFARALGIDQVDVNAMAAAQVWPGDRADCLLPFAIPDRWEIDGEAAGPEDVWEGPPEHVYEECDWHDPDSDCTGYSMEHIGDQIVLKMASPHDSPQPGWYYPIRLPGMSGANDYRDAIRECWPESGQYQLGEPLDTEQGNMRGPTAQAFGDLLRDSNFSWSENGDSQTRDPCPYNHDINACDWDGAGDAGLWRPVPMFEPPVWEDIDPGMSSIPISNFGGVFVEDVDPGTDDVLVRIVPFPGFTTLEEWADPGGSLIRQLRIVE